MDTTIIDEPGTIRRSEIVSQVESPNSPQTIVKNPSFRGIKSTLPTRSEQQASHTKPQFSTHPQPASFISAQKAQRTLIARRPVQPDSLKRFSLPIGRANTSIVGDNVPVSQFLNASQIGLSPIQDTPPPHTRRILYIHQLLNP